MSYYDPLEPLPDTKVVVVEDEQRKFHDEERLHRSKTASVENHTA